MAVREHHDQGETPNGPSGGYPGADAGHHPERHRTDRDLTDGADGAASDLTSGEQAQGELPDPPAEPDGRLSDADDAEGDLPDRDQPDRDLSDPDHPDG